MDSLDAGDYEDTDAEKENYILAQNKLWVITGEVASFSDQITALTRQAATVQSQLGNPSQITAPQTGYFIRSSSSGRLNAGSADILALDAANLKAYVESSRRSRWTAAQARSFQALPGTMPGCAQPNRRKSCWAGTASP